VRSAPRDTPTRNRKKTNCPRLPDLAHSSKMYKLSFLALPAISGLAVVVATPLHPIAPFKAVEPVTVTLSSRKVERGSIRRRALSPSNIPLQDYFDGTDLQWFGPIQVGTPAQTLTVVFDTGSFSLEIPGTSCTTCPNQRKFDGTQSSTFTDMKHTSTITFGTGVGVDPVIGNNWQLSLDQVQDVVSVGGLSGGIIEFFLITRQTPTFDPDPFDGIMGLGLQKGAFFQSLLNQGLPSLFSLFLTPDKVGGAELTLGGIDTSKFSGTPTFLPVVGAGSFWELTSSKVSVNGKTSSALQGSMGIIFDSGTSNLVFPQDIAEAMNALISPNIKANPAEPGTYGIPCSQVASLPAVIDFTFTTTSGQPFNLTIPSSELSVGPFKSDPTQCQTLVNAMSGLSIIGGSLLKHYYSIWDVGNSRMGFVKSSF